MNEKVVNPKTVLGEVETEFYPLGNQDLGGGLKIISYGRETSDGSVEILRFMLSSRNQIIDTTTIIEESCQLSGPDENGFYSIKITAQNEAALRMLQELMDDDDDLDEEDDSEEELGDAYGFEVETNSESNESESFDEVKANIENVVNKNETPSVMRDIIKNAASIISKNEPIEDKEPEDVSVKTDNMRKFIPEIKPLEGFDNGINAPVIKTSLGDI